MNIIILNQHTKNFGDDIAGISLIQELRKRFKDCKINIIYNTNGKLEVNDDNINHATDLSLKNIGLLQILIFLFFSLFKIKFIYNATLKKLQNLVKSSEFIFVSPCGANIGIYKDWRFLIRSLIVILLGGKLIFHNNTIGSSGNFLFDSIAKYILRRSDVYVREQASLDYLQSINVFSVRSVDTAFLFEDDSSQITEDYTVFIPTKLETWHPDFKNEDLFGDLKNKVLIDYVNFIQSNRLKLYILPHMHGEYLETELHNRYVSEFIKIGLPKENIKILNINDVYDYNKYIKNATLVVSMRYHGVVMSIRNSVPFISLGYENKMNEVCKYSNVEMLNYKLKNLKNPDFNIKFQRVWERRKEITSTLNESNKYLKKLASIAIDQTEFCVKNNITIK
jgi:colanic acid/amylovoran biosynthesis protein